MRKKYRQQNASKLCQAKTEVNCARRKIMLFYMSYMLFLTYTSKRLYFDLLNIIIKVNKTHSTSIAVVIFIFLIIHSILHQIQQIPSRSTDMKTFIFQLFHNANCQLSKQTLIQLKGNIHFVNLAVLCIRTEEIDRSFINNLSCSNTSIILFLFQN